MAPLQVYASAIIFSPSTSQIRKYFNHQYPQWANVTSPTHDISQWPSCLLLIEEFPQYFSVKLSYNQNGTRLLAPCAGWIEIIDSITGARIRNIDLDPENSPVDVLSKDATKFVSFRRTPYRSLGLLDVLNESWIELLREPDNVNGFAFSHDSKILAGVSKTCIRIWDTEQGELILQLTLESETVRDRKPKFLGNSTMIAIPFINKHIEILEARTGKRCYELQTVFDIDQLVPFPRDSSRLMLITKGREMYQWIIETREAVKMMDGLVSKYGRDFQIVAISPSDRIVAVFGDKSNLHIFILDASGHEHLEFSELPFYGSMAFSGDGSLLAVSTAFGEIWIWNTTSRTWTFRFEGHYITVYSLVFSPDAKCLASCGCCSSNSSQQTKIWPLDTPNRRRISGEQYESGKISNVFFSQDNKWIATVSDKSKVSLWSSSGRFERHLKDTEHTELAALKFSWDSTKLAFFTEQGSVGILDLENGRSMEIKAFKSCSHLRHCLEFSRNDGLLAASCGSQLKVFDVKAGDSQALRKNSQNCADPNNTLELKTACDCDTDWATILCIALFGTWVAGGCRYTVIYLWDVDTGQRIKKIDLSFISETTCMHVEAINMRSIGGSTQIFSSLGRACLTIVEASSDNVADTLKIPLLDSITFDQDDYTQLLTNLGKIDLTQFEGDSEVPLGARFQELEEIDLTLESSSGDYEDLKLVGCQGYGSSTDWVLKDGKRILWLPPDCRSHSIGINQIAIACLGGFLLCMTLPDDISSFFE